MNCTRAIVLLFALISLPSVCAEVIHIPVGQQAPEKHDLPRPTRGMNQAAVIEQFGLPESKSTPVGEPPISNWKYPNYTVYFESDIVIHSVLTHVPKVDLHERQ
ncbi:MAG: phosphodiesterase [Gammaproteobacteria bacterium]|jgi:hypothetical protein|nr:phosphodiesterase [Gammaproteobacteria bacterium]